MELTIGPTINPLALISTANLHGQSFIVCAPYKGLLFSQSIKLIQMNEETAVFEIPNQRICATLMGYIYLHTENFFQTICAFVDELNPRLGRMTLSHFRYLPSEWKDRHNDRVQPQRHIQVHLSTSKHFEYLGDLEDLSLDGMGVLVYRLSDSNFHLENGAAVHVEFRLPEETSPFKMEGVVNAIHLISSKFVILGLRILPGPNQKARIGRYIMRRRLDVFTELENIWLHAQEPRGTKDLFF